MKHSLRYILLLALLFMSPLLWAWQWLDLWRTADQQGTQLLQAGDAQQAAQKFKNKAWQGVANYRAGNYQAALKRFSGQNTSDGYYNAGNAAAFLERYQDAVQAYDKAIALDPNNTDAINNREIIKKLMQDMQKNKSSSKNSPSSKDDKTSNESKTADNKSDQQKNDQKNSKNSNNDTQADNHKSPQSKKENDHGQTNDQIENTQDKTQENAAESQASSQGQDEKQQIFRRIVDNPGGLLRQKFLRDYLRRHRDNNTFGQGDN